MKIEDLKPGVYWLAHDVTNPKPDRRASEHKFVEDWPRWQVIPKGMRFLVVDRLERYRVIAEELPPERIAAITPHKRYLIENYRGGGPTRSFRDHIDGWWATNHGERYKGANLFDLMVEALEPAPMTLDVWFTDRDFNLGEDAASLLASMVRHRIVTVSDLEAGLAALTADRKLAQEREGALPFPNMDALAAPASANNN